MSKIDRVHKEIAESEYNSYEVGKPATISQDYLIGTTLNFNDNRSGNREQIYVIVWLVTEVMSCLTPR